MKNTFDGWISRFETDEERMEKNEERMGELQYWPISFYFFLYTSELHVLIFSLALWKSEST